jgi:hypothetical protein
MPTHFFNPKKLPAPLFRPLRWDTVLMKASEKASAFCGFPWHEADFAYYYFDIKISFQSIRLFVCVSRTNGGAFICP